MNTDNDYDNDGNNIVPCPICLNVHCPANDFDQQGNNRNPDGKCPKEDDFVNDVEKNIIRERIYMHCPDLKNEIEWNVWTGIGLEHILRSIKVQIGIFLNNNEIELVDSARKEMVKYDLTKTFEENTSNNPELVNFLLNIIK